MVGAVNRMDGLEVSIIIPTLNEAENLPLLVPRIGAAMKGRSYEILIVDDGSADETVPTCQELARSYPLRLLARSMPKDGLGGAVLHGMAQARGECLAVMDADLQHPPERLGALLEPLEKDQADFVIGSRYMPGGSVEERWGLWRRANSTLATLLARPFAGKTRDPMAGFFALRRETYLQADRLMPLGYKIGLELMCKCRVKRVKEIPIRFGLRARGRSKLTLREQFRYLEHLSRLYDFTYPRASPYAKFVIATMLGWLAGLAVMFLAGAAGATLAEAATIGYAGVVGVTAILHLRYVRAQREFLVTGHPWRDFLITCLLEWGVCAGAAFWLAHRLNHPRWQEVFVLSFGAATALRYMMRKELMQDLRGLRRELRSEELR